MSNCVSCGRYLPEGYGMICQICDKEYETPEKNYGTWIKGTLYYYCSSCFEKLKQNKTTPYCPNCGAKMLNNESDNIKIIEHNSSSPTETYLISLKKEKSCNE